MWVVLYCGPNKGRERLSTSNLCILSALAKAGKATEKRVRGRLWPFRRDQVHGPLMTFLWVLGWLGMKAMS